jgi:hypothetical protein
VLAERDPDRAAAILATSDRLREAAGEARGGVRVIAEQVRHAHDRLIKAVGAERFALHETQGRDLSGDAAIALARTGLAVSS